MRPPQARHYGQQSHRQRRLLQPGHRAVLHKLGRRAGHEEHCDQSELRGVSVRLFLADGTSEPKWLLCLHQHSPYYLETLSWAFGCPDQIPDPTVQHFVLPSFDPPQFPSNDRPGQIGPRLDDEPPRSTKRISVRRQALTTHLSRTAPGITNQPCQLPHETSANRSHQHQPPPGQSQRLSQAVEPEPRPRSREA